jgi:hypothetical protein
MNPSPGPAPTDLRTIQQERRRARNCHELTELLSERADLRGVSPVADFFAEGARWTV